MLHTEAQRATTIGLTIRYDPTHPLQAQRQTLLNRHRCFHTITAVTITQTEAQGDASIPAHPQTEEHLFEIVTTVFAMPIGRTGRHRTLWLIFIRAIQDNSRGV